MEYYPGGMAEEFEVWEGFAHQIPGSISFEEATFLDGLAAAIHACDRAGVRSGSRVAVVGLGPIGMMAAQVARDRGAEEVVACDAAGFPVELAKQLGFESARNSDGVELFRHAAGRSARFDAIVDTVGEVRSIEAGLEVLAPGGIAVLLAVHEGTLSYEAMRISSEHYATTSANNRYADFRTAIELLGAGRIVVAPLINHRFPLSGAVRAFEVMAHKEANRAYKIVLVR